MIANYGYEDGSGFYYITVDGDVCATCSEHGCVAACPQDVFAIEMDDYDDYVAIVVETARKRLRELCSDCKAKGESAADGAGAADDASSGLPCVSACAAGALTHSW